MTRYYYLGGQRVAMRQGGVLTYLHGDHLGSASLATDVSGVKVSEMRYLPYGGTRSGSMPTDRQFTGQRWESSLGFYDYVARQYDPALGRFLQADTIVPDPANPQSLNRYSYTLGNPLRYTDPSGHFSEEQLNWLGYYKDSVSEEIWAFLLTLQPGDEIGYANQSDLKALILGQRSFGEGGGFGLWLMHGDERTELVQWLAAQDLHAVWGYRFGIQQDVLAWEAWCPTRGTFHGSNAQLFRETLLVRTPSQASFNRFFGGMWEELQESFPFLGQYFAAINIADTEIPVGHLEGDVRMTFAYYDSEKTMTERTIWLRPNQNALCVASDQWITFSWVSPWQGWVRTE